MTAQIELVRSSDGLASLQPEWDELASRSPAYPFTSHVWQGTWWQAFGRPPRSLHTLVLRRGGRVLGIFPLMLTRGRLRGIPLRMLTFAQSAQAPRADVLLREDDPQVLTELLEYLSAAPGWDCLVLRKIPVSSPSLTMLQSSLRDQGYCYHLHQSLRCPYVRIDGDWEGFLQSRSVKFRKSCRNKLNRVQRSHRMEVEHICDWARFTSVYDEICEVSSRSRLVARQAALASRPERVGFYRRLAQQAASRGWLSVWTLRFDGRMVAYEYHLAVNGVNHGLLAAFDDDFEALSPGSVLDYHVVRQLFLDGRAGYDQGGWEAFYKRRWTDQALEHVDLIAFPRRCRAALANRWEYGIVTWLRERRNQLRPSSGSDHAARWLAIRESISWEPSEAPHLEHEDEEGA
jgi:hypothetical protein